MRSLTEAEIVAVAGGPAIVIDPDLNAEAPAPAATEATPADAG